MILINFKIYKETFGERGIKLAKIAKETSDKYKLRIVLAIGALDALRIKEKTQAEVWLQNVDIFNEGKHTGLVSADQAIDLGIKGSLINHSENKKKPGEIAKILAHKPDNFEVMCATSSKSLVEKWTNKRKPEWFLFEPPELIASPDDSVANKYSQSIANIVSLAKGTPVLVGAGVKSAKDVEISLKMGAKGVGLASAYIFSQNPRTLLEQLAEGFGGGGSV